MTNVTLTIDQQTREFMRKEIAGDAYGLENFHDAFSKGRSEAVAWLDRGMTLIAMMDEIGWEASDEESFEITVEEKRLRKWIGRHRSRVRESLGYESEVLARIKRGEADWGFGDTQEEQIAYSERIIDRLQAEAMLLGDVADQLHMLPESVA